MTNQQAAQIVGEAAPPGLPPAEIIMEQLIQEREAVWRLQGALHRSQETIERLWREKAELAFILRTTEDIRP